MHSQTAEFSPDVQRSCRRFRVALASLSALALFLTLATYLQPGSHLVPGLDSSWAYGVNYMFQQRLVAGRDIYFTFGPLGFLEHTRPLTEGMVLLSTLVWAAISLLCNLALLWLAWCSQRTGFARAINLVIVIGLIVVDSTLIQRLLFVLYAGVLLHWQSRRMLYLLLCSLVVALAMMIKFSYGMVAVALWVPYALLFAWRMRDWRVLLIAWAGAVCCYWLLWFLVYGELTGSLGYLQGGLAFSQGSTSAMAFNPDNNWYAIAAFFAALLFALYCSNEEKSQRWLTVQTAFLGPIFIWSKYAFGLEDSAHLSYLMTFAFFAIPLWAVHAGSLLRKFVILACVAPCFLGWRHMHSEQTGPPDFSPAPQYSSAATLASLLEMESLVAIWRGGEQKALAPLALPAAMRARIGDATVDIYPWETIVAAANTLNWQPRPVFQNYIAYTPFLDGKNAAFYESARAPEFIVWHYHSFQDIAQRYPLSSDPLTLQAILTHYRLDSCDDSFCLWQRTSTPQLSAPEVVGKANATWDAWLPLPEHGGDILRARLQAHRNLLGKLNLALWKEGGIAVDYRLRDGSVKTHDLVIDNAVSGLWVSPYLAAGGHTRTMTPLSRESLSLLQQSPSAKGYFEVNEVSHDGLHVVGWGVFPYRNTRKQALSFLVYNDERAYVSGVVENRFRPGITDALEKRGIANLEHSGFDEVLSLRNIEPGTYHLRFVVRHGDDVTLSDAQDVVVALAPPAREGNVEAIRFRTTRPWAFDASLDLVWDSMTFLGERPW